VKLAFFASMMAGGAQLIPNAPTWAQTPDVRTEAIITAGILLGLASLLRRNMVTRTADSSQISASSLRDAA
jgi:hypothetical protein